MIWIWTSETFYFCVQSSSNYVWDPQKKGILRSKRPTFWILDLKKQSIGSGLDGKSVMILDHSSVEVFLQKKTLMVLIPIHGVHLSWLRWKHSEAKPAMNVTSRACAHIGAKFFWSPLKRALSYKLLSFIVPVCKNRSNFE